MKLGILALVAYLAISSITLNNVKNYNVDKFENKNATNIVNKNENSNGIDLSRLEKSVVKRVVDGDTFELTNGQKVRLIGVNTPESVKQNSPVEYFGQESSNYTKKMLTGKTVFLEKDAGDKDKYGRLLRYVYLEDKTMYNELLTKEGYARVMTVQPNVKYQTRFIEAERFARDNNKGLWSRQ